MKPMRHPNECFISLAQTNCGEVQLCRGCQSNFSFRFNNIFQIMSPDEFYQLCRHIDSVDADHFFNQPTQAIDGEERRIYLSTTIEPLYFCFTQPELDNLKGMLQHAVHRLSTLEKAWTELN